MNIQEFIEKYKLSLTVTQIACRTDGTQWDNKPYKHKNKYTGDIEERFPTHWSCKIIGNSAIKFEFSMGAGHYQDARTSWQKSKPIPPEINGVLECLRNDVVPFGTNFEDWCGDLGYETDSRKAESTFRACLDSTAKLVRLPGVEGVEELQGVDF